jgi:hypothetical protein
MRGLKGLAVVVAVVAALLVFGLGSAVATTLITSATIKNYTIKNVDIATGAVNSRVVANGSIASGDLSATARGSLGQLWAVVNADGTLARGRGATSAASLGVDGQYEVVFNRSVSSCAFVATIDSSASGYEGEISVTGREGNANAVFAQTYLFDPPGDANLPFDLAVFC